MSTDKQVLKNKAAKLKAFFTARGYKVKHTECLEAVSAIETGHCYNVAKNKEQVRILASGEKLSFDEMKEMDFDIDVVIPIDMDTIMNGIEAINDEASATITGCDYALCDIGYEVYPHFYNEGGVAIRVTGYIEDPSILDGYEEDEEDGGRDDDDEGLSPEQVFLNKLGYYTAPANIENQWCWFWTNGEGQTSKSDDLYDNSDEAYEGAWVDAVAETMGYFNMSDYEWDSLSERQQKDLMREFFIG